MRSSAALRAVAKCPTIGAVSRTRFSGCPACGPRAYIRAPQRGVADLPDSVTGAWYDVADAPPRPPTVHALLGRVAAAVRRRLRAVGTELLGLGRDRLGFVPVEGRRGHVPTIRVRPHAPRRALHVAVPV